jgi:hypothetical protein
MVTISRLGRFLAFAELGLAGVQTQDVALGVIVDVVEGQRSNADVQQQGARPWVGCGG